MTEARKYKPTGKIDVDNLYDAPTPAAYVQFLCAHDYQLPKRATPVVQAALARLRAQRGKTKLRVLDLGCSYGIMSAFLRHRLTLADLERHFHDADPARPLAAVIASDREYFAASRHDDDLTIVGIDPAAAAIAYAKATGLIDDGCALSLEDDAPLADEVAEILSGFDLVFSTGVIGYAGVATIMRLLALNEATRPWFLNFVLRGVDYVPIMQLLTARGYVTARDRNVYRQRRFAGEEERARWLDNLRRQGVDAAGYETTGYSCAELYLSRPAAEADGPPLLEAALL